MAKCVVCRYVANDSDALTIEREIDSPSRVYRDGIQELVDTTILHNIEIYSQGDLQRIADDEELRLELIDRPNKQAISSLQKQRANVSRELSALGPRIRAKATEIETRRADIRGLDVLRTQLSQLQSQRPQLSQELDAERESALKRKSLLQSAQHAAEERDRVFGANSRRTRHRC